MLEVFMLLIRILKAALIFHLLHSQEVKINNNNLNEKLLSTQLNVAITGIICRK